MTNINNSYKRIQSYVPSNNAKNNLKRDFMEQNYKTPTSKPLDTKKELPEKQDLKTRDTAFLKDAARLGVNRQGQFIKK